MSNESMTGTIDKCFHGHTFMKLDNHPMKNGQPRCPICMAEGLDRARQQLTELKEVDLKIILSFIDEGADELLVRRIWERVMRAGLPSMADSRKPEYIDNLIKTIRESHPDVEWLYHNGQCYNFYRILKVLYPDAEAWYNYIEGHVYTKIGNAYYDIRGVHMTIPNNSHPLSELDSSHKPEDWGNGDNRRLFRVEGLPQDPDDYVFKPNIPCNRKTFVLSSDKLMEYSETADLTDNLKLALKEIDECENEVGADLNREQTDEVKSLLEGVVDTLQPSKPRDTDK